MRCFVALDLPPPALAVLSRTAQTLRAQWPGLSWTNPGGYHLTLAFLGELDPQGVEAARGALRALAGSPAIRARFAGLGRFPPRGEARVLVVRLEDGGGSAALAAELGRRLSAALGWRADKAFAAHVTLARARSGARRFDPDGVALSRAEAAVEAAAPGSLLGAWTMGRAALYKSELLPSGAVYTVLEGIELAAVQATDGSAGVV